MKGKKIEELLNKKVKIKAHSNNEYSGKIIGYVPAQDNDPEIEEITVLNEKDNKTYSLFENEIVTLKIIE